MKRLILLLTLLFASNAAAQWQQSSGPEGGNIYNLTMINGKLVAQVNFESLYRLEGTRWVKSSTMPYAFEFFEIGDKMLAVRWDGIHVSTDEGDTWSVSLPLTQYPYVSTDKDTAYAVVNGELRRSIDGITWALISNNESLWVLTARDGILVGAPKDEAGMKRSTDGGTTFVSAMIGLPDTVSVGELTTDHGHFYAGTNAGIFRSSNAGESWERFESGLPGGMPRGYKQMFRRGEFTFLVTDDTSYIATLNGWKILTTTPPAGIVEHESVIHAAFLGDIHTTFFMGNSWTKATPPLLANTVRNIITAGQYMVAAGMQGIFRTADDGESWQRVSDYHAELLTSTGTTIHAVVTMPGEVRKLVRSQTHGDTWQTMEIPGVDQQYLRAIGRSTSYLYVGLAGAELSGQLWLAGGVLRSSDRGTTWEWSSTGLPKENGVHVPVLAMYSDDEVQIVTTSRGLYRSTDAGDSWWQAINGLENGIQYAPFYFTRIGEKIYAASSEEIYTSLDGGATWRELPKAENFILGIGRFEDQLYIIQNDEAEPSMFRLEGTEATGVWINIDDRLPQGVAPATVLEGGLRSYLGTRENGVWVLRRTASVDDVPDRTETVAYPNPAADVVTLALEGSEVATLTVYDMLGRVMQVVSLEPAVRNYSLDVHTYPLGAYRYSVSSSGITTHGSFTVAR
jgi:photosystem II stability/assembly factor-like uncharacterized protein